MTILLVVFQPSHYHLHHLHDIDGVDPAATGHDHVIDLHVLTEHNGQLHHDDEITTIDALPDGLVKKSISEFTPFILLTIGLLLLSPLNIRVNLLADFIKADSTQRYYYFTPLLRAPPLD